MASSLSNIKNMHASHIATDMADYEAARSNFFIFRLNPSMERLPKATYRGELDEITDDDRIGKKALEHFQLNITKANVPTFTVGAVTYDRGNEKMKMAGLPTWSDGQIVVDDIVGLDTKGILHAWKNAAYNPYTKKGGRMKNYKFDCHLEEYTQDYELIRSWILFGCWCSDVQDGEFDRNAGDGKRELTCKIEYDRAELDQFNETIATDVPDIING